MYRAARLRLAKRPWALDDFDAFVARVLSVVESAGTKAAGPRRLQLNSAWCMAVHLQCCLDDRLTGSGVCRVRQVHMRAEGCQCGRPSSAS
jgi:hypothetical protein